jgi:hypothetical protein
MEAKEFIVGVKEAQNKYHTYITAITPQITSKDNGLLRKAESQLITCCKALTSHITSKDNGLLRKAESHLITGSKDDFFRAREFKQIRESFASVHWRNPRQNRPSVSSAKQRTYSPAKKSIILFHFGAFYAPSHLLTQHEMHF